MAEGRMYERQAFKVLGVGARGDAEIKNPDGKVVFVSGVPPELRKPGTVIHIQDYRQSPGRADFARYMLPPISTQQPSPTLTQARALAGQLPTDAISTAPAQRAVSAGQTVYIMHIGPTGKGDDSAIAIVKGAVLDMKPYDGLMHLVSLYDDKSVFHEATDRRIAGRLHDIVERAKGEKALEELLLTIGNEPITPSMGGTLRDYFKASTEAGKYRAQAVVKKEGQQAKAEEATPSGAATAIAPAPPVHVARLVSTLARKGSPGDLPKRLDSLLQ